MNPDQAAKPHVTTLGLKDMTLLPPRPDVCQECARDHDPALPHNRDSLYYQMRFRQENDRWPTWADAMAHCDDQMKAYWRSALLERGVEVG